jgi:hypothetical protein
MSQKAFADRLMDFCDQKAEQIADQWYKSLITNPRTTSCRSNPKENCIRHAIFLYKNLKRIYFADDPYQEAVKVMDAAGFAEEQYSRRIPLPDAIYTLVLLRRHVWLYAESSALFNSANEMYAALQSTNRNMLIFDYLTYIVVQKYEKMAKKLVAV